MLRCKWVFFSSKLEKKQHITSIHHLDGNCCFVCAIFKWTGKNRLLTRYYKWVNTFTANLIILSNSSLKIYLIQIPSCTWHQTNVSLTLVVNCVLSTSVDVGVNVICVNHIVHMCHPQAAVLSPHQYSGHWKGGCNAKWKRKGNKPLEVSSHLIEVPLNPDATHCVLMSPQYVPPVWHLHPLNWIFQSPD